MPKAKPSRTSFAALILGGKFATSVRPGPWRGWGTKGWKVTA